MKATFIFTTAILGLATASAIHQELKAANTTTNLVYLNTVHIRAANKGPKPLEFRVCKGFDQANVAFDIHAINLDPNPIKNKRDVHIVVNGQANQRLVEGTKVELTLKKKNDDTHKLELDFCRGICCGCPVEPGPVEWWTNQHVPKKVRTLPFS